MVLIHNDETHSVLGVELNFSDSGYVDRTEGGERRRGDDAEESGVGNVASEGHCDIGQKIFSSRWLYCNVLIKLD